MMSLPALLNVVAVPEQAGPMLFYASLGFLAGGTAAVANADKCPPGLWQVSKQAVSGAFAGTVAGFVALLFAPTRAEWPILAAMCGGFVGPYYLWQLFALRWSAQVPPPPK